MRNPFKKLLLKLKLRYNLGREVITVYLPLVLSVVFVLASLFHLGYIDLGLGVGDEGDLEIDVSQFEGVEEFSEADMARLKQAKKKMEREKKGGGDAWLDDIVIFAVLIAMIPYSIDVFIQKKKLRRYEEEFSDFLFDMSEMMRGGIDPIKAIHELSKSNMGKITKHVRRATLRMKFGKSFDYSMREMASSMKSNLIGKYTDLLIHASFTGGNVSEIIIKSSGDMKKFMNLEREKEGNLKMYVIILYMAQGILVFLAAVYAQYLLPGLQGMNISMLSKALSGASVSEMLAPETTMHYLFHIVIINAFFVGIIAGKMSGGSVKFGMKHSVVLIVLTYVVGFYFILPPSLGENIKIGVVSAPKEGFLGITVPEPVKFKVTDLKGGPIEGTMVHFELKEPDGGGSRRKNRGGLKKEKETTDPEGIVSNIVTLGAMEGSYEVTAKVGGTTSKVIIKGKRRG